MDPRIAGGTEAPWGADRPVPPAGGVPRRGPGGLPWGPGAAALALAGVIAVAGAAAALSGSPATPGRTATPSGGRGAAPRALQPPPRGLPVVYYVDPGNRSLLVALDWRGQVRGAFRLPAPIDRVGPVLTSPDGSRLFVADSVFASSGTVVARRVSAGASGTPLWADDSSHLCALSGTGAGRGSAQTLYALQPGQPPRAASITTGGPPLELVGCSAAADRAAAVETAPAGVSALRLLRLSTGATLSEQRYDEPGDPAVLSVALSHDVRLVAENLADGTAVIRDAGGGPRLGTVTGQVVSFSGDDSLVAVMTADRGVAVDDWRTQTIDWSSRAQAEYVAAMPGSDALVIGVASAGRPRTAGSVGGEVHSVERTAAAELFVFLG